MSAATLESTTPVTSIQKKNGSAWLEFNPGFLNRRYGADFGERYHLDPVYRNEVNMRTAKRLHLAYGAFGMGSSNPVPSYSVGIQPLDFLNAAMGGRILYKENQDCWTPDKPLAHMDSVEAVADTPDIDWSVNPFLAQYWEQVEALLRHDPDVSIDSVQGVCDNGCDVMHTPCTTAFRLLGERIFEYMLMDEKKADAIMDYIMRQYLNLWSTIRAHMGWRQGKSIHLGDCTATMLSPALYERLSLTRYRKLLTGGVYSECSLHSCGPSTHLLEFFRHVPGVKWMQLGDGTDLTSVRALFPEAFICAYFNAANIMSLTPQRIEARILEMAETLRHDFVIVASSVDPETPEVNILAFLKTAQRVKDLYSAA